MSRREQTYPLDTDRDPLEIPPSSSGPEEENQDSPNYKTPSERSGLIKFVLFMFALPTVLTAYRLNKKGLSLDAKTLPGLPYKFRAEVLEVEITRHYEQLKKKHPNRPSNLAIAVIKATLWEVIVCHVLEIAFLFLRIFSAFCLKKLLDAIMYEDIEDYMAYVWAVILSVSQMLSIYVEHHMYQLKCALPLYVKGALISMIYTKVNKLSVYALNQLSVGKLVNIVTNDLNIFDRSGLFFTHLITGIVGLIGGTALLWTFFDVTVLLGIGFMLLTLPIQKLITNMSVKPREKLKNITDLRVKATNEVLEGIRLLKMYTWELIFRDNIEEIRKKELKLLKEIRRYDSFARAIAYSTHAMTTYLIFMLYTLTGGTLRSPEVFASHNLFTFMRKFSAIFVGQGIIFLAEAKLLLERISTILDTPEIKAVSFDEPVNQENSIEFEGFSASWASSDETLSPNRMTLSDVNMNIKKGSLNALVGKVGAGKTSLLLSFTGEMPKIIGSLRYRGTIAYVEQEPTIFAGTIRENILFGKSYKPRFYQKVIEGCNLESDLKLFPRRDLSEAGERGNNLSGGQKARLALARAVYANADIYLLDDPLSAVDAKVAKSLYNHVIKGLLGNKTVILVTHQVHFVKDLASIMIIEDGKIVAHGSHDELTARYPDIEKVFPPDHHKEDEEDEEEEENSEEEVAKQEEIQAKFEPIGDAQELEDEEPNDTEEARKILETQRGSGEAESQLIKPEDSKSGRVTLKIYVKYFGQTGNTLSVILLYSLFVITQFGNVGYGRILAAWTTEEFDRETSLAVAGGFAGFILVIYMIEYFVYNYMTLTASRRYHSKMLDTVIKNPVSFFDTNPLGRVLNRFSNDMGALDSSLPSSAIDAIDENAIIISLLIALAILKPWILLPLSLAVVGIIFCIIICYPSIEQTIRYELVSRSPLVSQFSSTLSGIIIIRSYKQIDLISKKFQQFLNNNTKGSVGYTTVTRFFAIYVDVSYTLAAIANTFIVAALGGDPGLAGFALMLIVSVTGAIQFALRQLLQAHILMSSAARVQSYCEMKTEAALSLPRDKSIKDLGWPQHGEIDFRSIYMKYRPELDYVLRDLTLHAKPGEKVGCVGRTGAGKSTIIQILFRMVEIDRSEEQKDVRFVKIDAVDTQTLGLHTLRDNISIIPQLPFCFTGSIRKNLDPMDRYSDEELWRALEDVNLKEYVQSLGSGLSTDMSNASSLFSVGQKQLVCLARAILKKSKMLVLDEATANVDLHTDNFIQGKIFEKFNECTIFTIAHRLTTIANYDRVLVLHKGKKIEYDHPYQLLVKNIGDEAITNIEGDFASMVMNTGPKTSQKILQMAKKAYYDQKSKRENSEKGI